MQVYTVSHVTEYLGEVISDARGLQDLWVEAEVAEVKVSTQGHCYVTLKDARNSLRCIMFRSHYSAMRFALQPGMTLLAHGRVTLAPGRSEYQLIIDRAQPAGVGDLFLAFEQVRLKLAAEGLFDEGVKRPLPRLPARLAVVTSETGAALRDVLKVLRRRCPGVPVLFVHTLVQGETAPAQLVRALRQATSAPGVDVVLLVRGGGSIEDLAAFNDEDVARAIRASPVPVIVGVGHETDTTIADYAADVRAPTPSAAAELAVPDIADWRRGLLATRHRLELAVTRELVGRRERLGAIAARLERQSPARQLPVMRQRVDDRSERLQGALRATLDRASRRLSADRQRLEALSPLAVLARGYSLVRDESGGVVTSVTGLTPGRRLQAVFADGRAFADVVSVEPAAKAGAS